MLAYRSRYFNLIAPFLWHYIAKRNGHKLAARCYHDARPIYRDMLAKAPNVGAKNPMAHNIYMALVFFAMYRASGGELTKEDLRAAVGDFMNMPLMHLIGRMDDLNTPQTRARFERNSRQNEQWRLDHLDQIDASWDFNFDGGPQGDGVWYYFTYCPINQFCRENGLLDVLPIMCDIDYKSCALAHGVLRREHTLALDGKVCDYWMVGDGGKGPR